MNDTITGESSMREVLQVFPGAQRALFRKYHIGGCSSCSFGPEETLSGVCERNGDLPVDEVIEKIQQSHILSSRYFFTLCSRDARYKVRGTRYRVKDPMHL